MADVEARVNDVLAEDLAVTAEIMSQEQARAAGAMALFGEKYGDRVRVVSVGDWARELCGGTHAQRSGQVGLVKFLSEGSIGTGVRRVEALVGADAYRFLAREHLLVAQLAEIGEGPPRGAARSGWTRSSPGSRTPSARSPRRARRTSWPTSRASSAPPRRWGSSGCGPSRRRDGTDAGGLRELVTKGRDAARRRDPVGRASVPRCRTAR